MIILLPLSQQDQQNNPRKPDQSSGRSTGFRIPLWYIVAGVALLLLIQWAASGNRQELPYGKFRSLLKEGKIEEVVIYNDQIQGTLASDANVEGPVKFSTTRVKPDDELLKLLDDNKVSGDADQLLRSMDEKLDTALGGSTLVGPGWVVDRHPCARLGQALGYAASDTTARARDERVRAVQSWHVRGTVPGDK